MKAFDLTGMKSLNIKNPFTSSLLLVVSASKMRLGFSHLFLFLLSAFLQNRLETWDKRGKEKNTTTNLELLI